MSFISSRSHQRDEAGHQAFRSVRASTPAWLAGSVLLLLGLQLTVPALIAATGRLDRALATFPPQMPLAIEGLAVIGAFTMLAGFVQFMKREPHRV